SGQPRQGSAVSGVPYLGGTAWATIPRWMGRGRLGVERRGVLWRSYPVSRGRENEKPRRQFERPVGRDGGMRGSTRGRGGSRRAAAPAAHALPSRSLGPILCRQRARSLQTGETMLLH